jgi:hypothetical protein
MRGRPEHLVHLDRGHAVRLVLIALTTLVLHDVALPVDALRRHRVEQVRHAIGLEEQRQIERVLRHVDHVVRSIVGRGSVVVAAGAFEERIEHALLDVLRPFEHQVLEQVGEARAARLLIGRADVIPDVHRDHRHALVLVKDDVQPIAERELLVGY